MWFVNIVFVTMVTRVYCNPGRPSIPVDPNAANIFQTAETQSNSPPDGFLSETEMNEIFVHFDMNGDQCIDMTEFIAHWTGLNLGELDKAVRLFHHADTDTTGCIQQIPDFSRLFYYFDRDGDKRISEEEFQTVWFTLSA
ncbi:hypothetical protein ACF0H5_021173 [Mactra antiquata]